MNKVWFTIAAAVIAALMSGCTAEGGPAPKATSSASATTDPTAHESGPESPIAFGLQVPRGAVQLAPLVRFRSPKLIAAYQPSLDAALQQKEAAEQQRAEDALKNGETVPTPAPTPITRPSDDTFKPIEDPPKPDSTISLMRIDGKPSSVVSRMVEQIAAVLPENLIDTSDLSSYCDVKNDRHVGCKLDETGLTADKLEVQIKMTVDLGDVATRTAPAAAQTRPIMTVSVSYVGDPTLGQKEPPSTDVGKLPSADDSKNNDALIWPKMDVDADPDAPLLDGTWTVPSGANLLLSGNDPRFVALHTATGRDADKIARSFVESHSQAGEPAKDVVEDLNEISTTYRANSAKKGLRAQATYVLSGRGTYVLLFYSPPETGKS